MQKKAGSDKQSFCGDCGTKLGQPQNIPDVTKTPKNFRSSILNRYEELKRLVSSEK